jgi:hypothetical protein
VGCAVCTHLSDLAKGLIFSGIVVVLAIGITFVPLDGEAVPSFSMFIPLAVVDADRGFAERVYSNRGQR